MQDVFVGKIKNITPYACQSALCKLSKKTKILSFEYDMYDM